MRVLDCCILKSINQELYYGIAIDSRSKISPIKLCNSKKFKLVEQFKVSPIRTSSFQHIIVISYSE